MNYTSVEQSKRLLELGLRPETSDMIYSMVNGSSTPFIRLETIDELDELHDVVCWTSGALQELMPATIGEYILVLIKAPDMYGYCYINSVEHKLCLQEGETPIEVCYNMMVWLLENNYIKKEGNT